MTVKKNGFAIVAALATSIVAFVLLGSGVANGQASPQIVINEIDYNPDSGPEYLELLNIGANTVDLTGWELDGFGLLFPAGTQMAPNEYLVVTESIVDFQAEYPGVTAALVEAGGGLSNGGEELTLLDGAPAIIDIVEYGDAFPWPTQPDGFGPTLSLFDSTSDNNAVTSWGISATDGGTPGVANDTVPAPAPDTPDVVINELHYNPDGSSVEFVELFNLEGADVDVSDWIMDDLFVFPAGTMIATDGFLIVTADVAAFSLQYPGVPTSIIYGDYIAGESLSNGGETINLSTGTGVQVDTVEYEDGAPWTDLPDGDGPSLELRDPTLDNELFGSWQASGVLGGSPGAHNVPACNGQFVNVDIGAGQSPTPGDDVILGTPNADLIVASTGNDTICGLAGDDTINTGSGDDWVDAGAGDDAVFGLDGNDEIYGRTGADEIIGGNDDDIIEGGDGDDTLNGGPGADIIEGNDDDDNIFGQGGDDTLEGGDGADFIIGVDGNDTIEGGDGNDTLNGGPGVDDINGDADDDVIFGLSGDDGLSGGDGDDLVFGQLGADTIAGGAGDDKLWGNQGDDVVIDPSGSNTLNGGPGNDTLTGGADDDQIFGDGDVTQAGDDVIDGGLGTDVLIGFAGVDTITANDGIADTVNGGPGVDSCATDAADTVFNCP